MPVAIKRREEQEVDKKRSEEEMFQPQSFEVKPVLETRGNQLCIDIPETLKAAIDFVLKFGEDEELVVALKKRIKKESINLPEELKILLKLLA